MNQPRAPKAVVAYTEGRKVLCLAAVDREQAETVIGIIEQAERERLACADAMERAVMSWVLRKGKIRDLTIGVNTRRGHVVDSIKTPLPGRVVVLLIRVCRNKIDAGRELLVRQLRGFVAGQVPTEPFRPYLAVEFTKPLILPAGVE